MIINLGMGCSIPGDNVLSFSMSPLLMIIPNEQESHGSEGDGVLRGDFMDLRMAPDEILPGL